MERCTLPLQPDVLGMPNAGPSSVPACIDDRDALEYKVALDETTSRTQTPVNSHTRRLHPV
jgi:hypothetical protein